MVHAEMLSAVGLIRTYGGGACRIFQSGDGPQEISAPALIGGRVSILAVVAWGLVVARMSSMDDMGRGLGPIDVFAVGWTVMMLPSAMPVVFEFARNAERRRGSRTATALLGVTYLGIRLAFGVACYLVYNAVGMPWPNQGLVGGVALILAGLYALTPLKRASEARCRALCAVHGPLPFNLMRSAMVAGADMD